MLSSKIEQLGQLQLTIYTFEKAGDILPMHFHDEDSTHITFIGAGQMRCTNGVWTKEGGIGEMWDFDAGSHEFEALTDGAKIYNIRKTFLGDLS